MTSFVQLCGVKSSKFAGKGKLLRWGLKFEWHDSYSNPHVPYAANIIQWLKHNTQGVSRKDRCVNFPVFRKEKRKKSLFVILFCLAFLG